MFRSFAIVILILISFQSYSGKIERGYEALEIYNYFKAKSCFEKSLKRQPSVAAYGLSIIYFRKDNPFHNIDSAFRYIKIAEEKFSELDEKMKEKWKVFGFEYLSIIDLRSQVSSEHFIRAAMTPSEKSYDSFMDEHPWAGEFELAHYRRDSIAYQSALETKMSTMMNDFLKRYPDSEFFNKAQEDFFRFQYYEFTNSGNLSSYLDFLKTNSESPYAQLAEDRVYEIVTGPNNIESLEVFVKAYPRNRNIGEAWRRIYQLFMSDYAQERFEEFKKTYPSFPYTEELELDFTYSKRELLPYLKEGKYGFINFEGRVIIQPEYDYVGFFKEGLSVVSKDNKFGFIDKGNRVKIPLTYENALDFDQGRAVVELNELLGMIDRNGVVVFDFEFEDLGNLSGGLIYASKNGLYGYYDKNANLRVPHQFDEAFSFIDDKAKVVKEEKEAFVDIYGTYLVPPGYSDIRFFNDSLLIYESNGNYGLMYRNCSVYLEAQFQEIGDLVEGRALIVKDDYIGYLDQKGNVVIAPKFDLFPNYQDKGSFKDKLAVVKYKGKYAVIDPTGKLIIPNIFQDLGSVSDKIAFSKGKGWGYMDNAGKEIMKPAYEYAESFLNGFAIVELGGAQGVIDPKGSIIVPLEYGSIVDVNNAFWMVSKFSKYGLLNKKGEIVVPLEYDKIIRMDDMFVLVKENEIHYFYEKEMRMIKEEDLNE